MNRKRLPNLIGIAQVPSCAILVPNILSGATFDLHLGEVEDYCCADSAFRKSLTHQCRAIPSRDTHVCGLNTLDMFILLFYQFQVFRVPLVLNLELCFLFRKGAIQML